ncbi:MAG: hypothetical protein KDA84_24505 [Planctomycetaceae bacterium]|nr:hypothetical protein [Planctomycetaceae bacterium]
MPATTYNKLKTKSRQVWIRSSQLTTWGLNVAEVPYPTDEGANELAAYLDVQPEAILCSDQDWEYIYPKLEQLPIFLDLYRTKPLSDQAKRVVGCFIFQALEYHLKDAGEPTLVLDSLKMLHADYRIHQPEFEYWSCLDCDDSELGPEETHFAITKYVRPFLGAIDGIQIAWRTL